MAARHLHAAQIHDEAAKRWEAAGEHERAEFERRAAQIMRDAQAMERDRAAYEETRDDEAEERRGWPIIPTTAPRKPGVGSSYPQTSAPIRSSHKAIVSRSDRITPNV